MIASIDTITAVVECPNPQCRWRGQVAACGCKIDEIVHCPLCRSPVEMECDPPAVVLMSDESDPNAITR